MIINLTPHSINLVQEGKVVSTIEPSGVVARCSQQDVRVGSLAGVPLYSTSYGEVSGLPEKEDGVCYVVSLLVAQNVPSSRDDVLITVKAVRDAQGRIVGCEGLSRFKK